MFLVVSVCLFQPVFIQVVVARSGPPIWGGQIWSPILSGWVTSSSCVWPQIWPELAPQFGWLELTSQFLVLGHFFFVGAE